VNQHATLGRSGLRVSRLGLGAYYGLPAREVERAFHEHGVNYLFYGSIKRRGMRRAIRHLARSDRERMVVSLCLFAARPNKLRASCQACLRELGLDHADVLTLAMRYQHPEARTVDAALQLRDEGRIRHLAISGHDRRLFAQLARQGADSPFDVIMLRYNAAHRGAESEIFPLLPTQQRPGIISFTATRWGHLLDPRWMPPGEAPLTSAQCYRFALTHPAVDLCLTGPSNARQLDEALQALHAGPLEEEELARARRLGDWVHEHPRFSPYRILIDLVPGLLGKRSD